MAAVDVLHPCDLSNREPFFDHSFKPKGLNCRQNYLSTVCPSPFKGNRSISADCTNLTQKIEKSRKRSLKWQTPSLPAEDPKSPLLQMQTPFMFSSSSPSSPSVVTEIQSTKSDEVEDVRKNEEEIRQKLIQCRLMQQQIYQTQIQIKDQNLQENLSLSSIQTTKKGSPKWSFFPFAFFLQINPIIQRIWSAIVILIKSFLGNFS